MRIGELARRAGVTPRALRYYEDRGLLSARRAANGYREYDEVSVAVVDQIRCLLDAGFNSGAVARILPCMTGSSIELCPQVQRVIAETVSAIEIQQTDLEAQRRRVDELLAAAG